MATARRFAANREDAEDAYQRGVEILLTKAPTTDVRELLPWLKTVVKHEAFALRRQGDRHGTPSEHSELEPIAGGAPGPAELAERRERLRLGAEAMGQLKPQEVRALLLRADGLSYAEICEATGWTYTKVNRCLSEGRRSFLERVAGIETGAECERLAPLLSALADGEARAEDVARLRPHLRGCLACRARLREYRGAPAEVAALVPAGVVASIWAALSHGAHAVSGWCHARAQLAAARWHDVADAAVAHKTVAVVASTAAIAGGGAATVATLSQPSHPHPAAAPRRAAHAPRRSLAPAAATARIGPFARKRAEPLPPGARRAHAKTSSRATHRRTATTAGGSEFGPGPAGQDGPARGEPAAPQAADSRSTPAAPGVGGEFAP